MTETYSKLFSSILGSSIWGEDDQVVRVWITMLAMKDHNCYVGASTGGLAHLARVPVEAVERALRTFLAPDPDSRSQEFEGRRIEVADRGWNVLNHDRFRDMRNEDDRRARDRDRKRRARLSASVRAVPLSSTHAESDADAESDPPPVRPSASTSVPVPLAVHAEAGGRAGGEPPVAMSPDGASDDDRPADGSPEQVDMVLDAWGWGSRLPDRLGLCRELIAQGITMHDLTVVSRMARQQGKDPAALGMTWLQSGAWRDVVADHERATPRRNDGDVPGPMYGEPMNQKAIR